jgi:hypothetical protein
MLLVIKSAPKVHIADELNVSALIDNNTRQWNQKLVTACFSPSDADKILSEPLSFCSVSDRVACPLTKIGAFTIKSAYVMEKCQEAHLKINKQGRGEFSNQIQTAKEWKKTMEYFSTTQDTNNLLKICS